MTKLQAMKESLLRGGMSPDYVEKKVLQIMALGGLPPDANMQIPAGREEEHIKKFLQISENCRRMASSPFAHLIKAGIESNWRERNKSN